MGQNEETARMMRQIRADRNAEVARQAQARADAAAAAVLAERARQAQQSN